MADHLDSSPLIPPSPITEHSEIDLEVGPGEQIQIQCRICLKTDGRDFIAPCKCKGTSKYVHRECLDHWRAVREGFAFAHCTTCKAPYHLRVHVVADRKWRTLKFRFFVTRDIIFIFLAVQLVIASLAYLVYLIDGYQQFWLRLAWGFDSELSFCYICGALLFFALLGLSGRFITCYDRRVCNVLAQPCRELCLCCCQPGPKIMNSPSAQFVPSRGIGVHEHIHQIGMCGENFKSNGNLNTSAFLIVEDTKLDNLSEDTSHGTVGPSNQYDQEATDPADKAYVQHLETSRLKLIQLEQDLERARQRGLYLGGGLDASHLGFSGTVNSGIAAFEMEYGHWVEEQNRQICELRSALNAHISDTELQSVVDSGMQHYAEFFRLKATAAKADVFYVMSGMWKTSAEHFFLWIGGFRPFRAS